MKQISNWGLVQANEAKPRPSGSRQSSIVIMTDLTVFI